MSRSLHISKRLREAQCFIVVFLRHLVQNDKKYIYYLNSAPDSQDVTHCLVFGRSEVFVWVMKFGFNVEEV